MVMEALQGGAECVKVSRVGRKRKRPRLGKQEKKLANAEANKRLREKKKRDMDNLVTYSQRLQKVVRYDIGDAMCHT